MTPGHTTQPSTHDLRSRAVPRKREIKAKTKWSAKWAYAPGCEPVKVDASGTKHPSTRFHSQNCQIKDRALAYKDVRKEHNHRKYDGLNDDSSSFSSRSATSSESPRSSGEAHDDQFENLGMEGPAADVDVFYSFDARKGPSNGRDVFEVAMNKAVRKFEDGQVERMVNEQYDVVDEHNDVEYDNVGALDEDDFELV